MSTSVERSLARIRRYFELNPKALAEACREVRLPYTTARDALKPDRSPQVHTVVLLEKMVPDDFEPEAANG